MNASLVSIKTIPKKKITNYNKVKMGIKPKHNGSIEDVVISGYSGRFPNCNDIKSFKENLLNGNDMVTTETNIKDDGVIHRAGRLKEHKYFDSTFFRIHAKQAYAMDPQVRMLLEATYEAIIDAGVNPEEIRGSKTGVFVGASISEAFQYWTGKTESIDYAVTGCARSMLANWISYVFDFVGPSVAVDTACSSSLFAMQQAFDAIRNGQCDSAIVAGVNLLFNPNITKQFRNLSMLSPDGKCKSFDASADGFVRAEAVVSMYIQKSSVARRIYATILGIKSNCDGYKEEGITHPNSKTQCEVIKGVYEEFGINCSDVEYMETHGTGTKVGDLHELNSIVSVFCGDKRKEPLLIGSVKSNIGHSETAAGLCSVAKVLIAMENGVIPTNLHYNTPNPNIPALTDGRLKVVSNNQKWNGGKISVNSFGFGGVNVHLVLSSNPKKNATLEPIQIPRLIAISGRTEEAVSYFIDGLINESRNEELYALVDEIHKKIIPQHDYRGYCMLHENKVTKEVAHVITNKPKIWFVFTGMGCQYPGMGEDLMNFWPLKQSIESSAAVLKLYGVNLMDALAKCDSLLYSFVAITAIQIALVDLMNLLNIKPDGVIGHSIGEIGCAYADATITPEQAILLAYYRAISLTSTVPAGAMASIGITKEEFNERAPPEIFIACYNAINNLTISGPPDAVKEFTEKLRNEGVFVKDVNVFNYAFHTKYMKKAEDTMRKSNEGVIPHPKPRSSKWLSTSVKKDDWNSPLAKFASAEYFVNNLLSPVYFDDAIKHIPEDAVVLEIAPHCLLQSVLKRSLPKCNKIGLLNKNCSNKVEFLISNIGRLYNYGCQPNISALYPSITFPVSRGTPTLSNLVQWNHSMEWPVPNFTKMTQGKYVYSVTLKKEEFAYLEGHVIDGKIIFPITGYLVLVWKAFAKIRNEYFEKYPIVLENIEVIRATILPKEGSVKLSINILESSGIFEITEDRTLVAKGKIYAAENSDEEFVNYAKNINCNGNSMNQDVQQYKNEQYCKEYENINEMKPFRGINNTEEAVTKYSNGTEDLNKCSILLNPHDIYKELNLRGYNYKNYFRGIINSNLRCTEGMLKWEKNWVTFMDTMLQFYTLGDENRSFGLPTRIRRIAINPKMHLDCQQIPVYSNKNCDTVKSGGIVFTGLECKIVPRRAEKQFPILEKYQFVKLDGDDKGESLINAIQLVCENNPQVRKFKIISDFTSAEVLKEITEIIESQPELTTEILTYTTADIGAKLQELHNIHLLVLTNVLLQNNHNALEDILSNMNINTFILFKEDNGTESILNLHFMNNLQIISGNVGYILARKVRELRSTNAITINIKNDPEYNWLEELKQAEKLIEKNQELKVYLYSQGDDNSGLTGLLQCILKEWGAKNIRSYLILDKNAPVFSLTSSFYKNQLEKDLVQNIFQNNCWGTMRHLPFKDICYERNNAEHMYLDVLTTGDLSTFSWIESPLKFARDNLVKVHYAGLNFKDVLLATGKLANDRVAGDHSILGLEFSGINQDGNRVMGLSDGNCFATSVRPHSKFIWNVPKEWSLEDAATVPIVYTTSYYALVIRGKLQPGESILIHSGCGGVGQASITIALHMGCKVFTTVGNPQKRKWLLTKFPQLTEKQIGNSRDTSFEQMIKNETNGRGVNLVLNSLNGEKLQASVRCLAEGGRFLEIGKVDLVNNTSLGLSVFLKNVSFHGILLDSLMRNNGSDTGRLWDLLEDGVRNGVVRPLHRQVFPANKVEDAFRFLGSGKHIGKILLEITKEGTEDRKNIIFDNNINDSKADGLKPYSNKCLGKTYMDPRKVYIIVGGLGGFGLELAEWLIARGAKKIILTSRNGIKTGFQAYRIKLWEDKGVKIIISTLDIAIDANAKKFITKANLLGSIGGIFNLALLLKDDLIQNLTTEDFKIVCKPKINITVNLDKYSRLYAPNLDHFVVFSSIFCGRGNFGQANYGYANSVMERVCINRKLLGLAGLAIQWGAINDVGILYTYNISNKSDIRGVSFQKISSCLSTLDTFMQQQNPVVGSFVLLSKNKTNENVLQTSLCDKIANILGIDDYKKISNKITLANLGMDSLMTTEVIQTLERDYDSNFSTAEAKLLTFNQLEKLENEKSTANKKAQKSLLTLDTQKENSVSKTNEMLSSFCDKIASVLGIDDYTKISDKITLANLGMNTAMSKEIIKTLESEYEINVTTEEVNLFTFEQLKKIEIEGKIMDKKRAFKNIFSLQGNLMPKETCVKIPSKINNHNTNPVFIVHSIEGTIDNVRNLCSGLSFPVYGLQYTAAAPAYSIEELARFYIGHIKKINTNGPYKLIGYSYGANVALEMAMQLEISGEEVSVLLIDGSPKYIRHITELMNVNKKMYGTEVTTELNIIRAYLRQLNNIDTKQVIQSLSQSNTWDEKVTTMIKLIASATDFNADEIRISINCWYNKIMSSNNYKMSGKFNGKTMLIKASDKFMTIEEDYGLSNHCSQLDAITLEGTHQSIVNNTEIIPIINTYFN